MPSDRYFFASSIYDAATALWSGGAIWKTRSWSLDIPRTHPEQARSVFIPGPGTGRLAVVAALEGHRVVAVDRSAAMLRRAQRRANRAGAQVRFVLGELDSMAPGTQFDLVVCEHFLNVFEPEAMRAVRSRLIDHVRVGGFLAIADFTPIRCETSRPIRALQRVHHVLPLFGCAMLTKNAMHPIYDHGTELAERSDLRPIGSRDARSFRVGPAWFRTWIFERVQPQNGALAGDEASLPTARLEGAALPTHPSQELGSDTP